MQPLEFICRSEFCLQLAKILVTCCNLGKYMI